MPQNDVDMWLRHARVAGVEHHVYMINISARGKQIVEVHLRRHLSRGKHVDGADQLPVAVVSQEWSRRKCFGIDEELPHAGNERGQFDQRTHFFIGFCRWCCGDCGCFGSVGTQGGGEGKGCCAKEKKRLCHMQISVINDSTSLMACINRLDAHSEKSVSCGSLRFKPSCSIASVQIHVS